jgi:hypothetical protein
MSTTQIPESTPEKLTPVSAAVFCTWENNILEKKYRQLGLGNDAPKSKPKLQTAVLQGLCQQKLLSDSAMAYDDVPTGVPSSPAQIFTNAPELSLLKSTVDKLTHELETLRSFMATVTETPDSLVAQVTALREEVQELKSSDLRQRDQTEMRERAVRRNRLCLTRLPEAPDTQSDADLLATVNELLSSIDCKAKAISAYRVGRKPGSYADKVAPTGVKTRPIIVTMPTWDDKIEVLRRKKHLANTSYAKIGVDEDLTPTQTEHKQACWSTFVQARKEGKRAQWRAHSLFVEGKLVSPPNKTTT